MGISPWYMTSNPTAPIWTIPLVPDGGMAFPVAGLTASNFSLLIKNLATGIATTGQGTFLNITPAVTTTINGSTVVVAPAQVNYQLVSADVAIGRYEVYVLVTLSNGGVQPFLFEEDWRVVPL